jgi:hypothetical protein
MDLRFARFLQFRLHKLQSIATLALAEFAFYGIPFTRFLAF